MAGPYKQEKRIGELKTPLGDDTLVLVKFEATEGVSELFEFRITALCAKKEILDFTEAIGKHCSVSINVLPRGKRWFDGILTETQCLGPGTGGLIYSLVLRPWLWVLSQRSDSWIFHEKTAPQIIEEVFDDHPGLAVRRSLLGKSNYPKLEYCVQYRESDMAFVCRLMEQHGINYHFRHSEGKHELILGDDSGAWQKLGKRPYYDIKAQHMREEEHFFEWVPERRFTTGVVTLKDYNFKTPGNKLQVRKEGDARYVQGKLEGYDYPGLHTKEDEGNFYAQVRIDMERAADERFLASGDCASCFPGALVSLAKHPSGDQNKDYVALRCTHSLTSEQYRSVTGGVEDVGAAYSGSYELMPATRAFAPPMVTEVPVVQGPQTAIVVGDNEISCDEYGRIKVQFHWDRGPDKSMWCRLSQVWAGKNWGGIFIPRKGMEVIVEFLEGNPDRPIIVGCVYNADNMPPYKLKDQKNIAGLKSNSTEGGNGYNEFIFDDTKGKELIRTHAQYDLETTIEHDERRTVGKTGTVGNRTSSVGVDDTLTVGKNLKVTAGDSIVLLVGAASLTMKKDGTIILKGKDITVTGTGNIKSNANLRSEHVAGADMIIQGAMVKINS